MKKRKIVIVGLYLQGIYPRGQDDVVADLLAPAYLKAVVDADPTLSAGYDVTILNLPTTITKEELVDAILKEDPYMAAFSVYIWNFEQMNVTSTLLRETKKDVHIVWGGPEVSYNAADMMKINLAVDVIVCGSGEQKFMRLLETNMTREEVSLIPSVAYRDSDGEIKQTLGNIPDDLTKIPSPFQSGTINLNDGRRHSVYLETYRGCIFQCGYCMWMGDKKKEIVLFPLEQILKDIDIIYNNPSVEAVVFTDACIFYRRERAKQICDRISAASRTIPTTLTLDIAFMDEDSLDSLKKIHFEKHQGLHFGMQSINQETLRLMNRKIGPELIAKRIKMIRELEPSTEISFDLIYGLPGDNHEDFRNTVNFALHLSPSKLNLSPLVLLPGSPYWINKEAHGFIYDPYPPYLIHSNRTYSASDMKNTRRFVLGVMMVMYFSAIREALYQISEHLPNLKRVELFEDFISRFEKRTNLLLDITKIRDQDQYSPSEVNYIRRNIMNGVAESVNGVYAFVIVLEMIKEYGLEGKFDEKLRFGLEFYKDVARGATYEEEADIEARYRTIHGATLVDDVKFNWVSQRPVGITKAKGTDGIAAICG